MGVSDLILREAREDDFEFYYQLKSEKSAVYWSGFESAPDRDRLLDFWNKYVIMDNPERKILILQSNNEALGYLQAVFDKTSIGLSMGIREAKRGYGFGKQIIGLAVNFFAECLDFYCYVREDNISSMNCFTSNGFRETGELYP